MGDRQTRVGASRARGRSAQGGAPYVIAIGASAGGLSALSAFCAALGEDIDAAVVVVPHLAPEQPSGMVRLLARQTDLTVRAIHDGLRLERGVVHVLVPGRLVRLEGGRLRLRIDHGGPLSMPIDRFLISMAADCGRRCAGVILSGTGSDGVRGIRAVHRSGGAVLVQSPDDARFDGMPRAALATGMVDTVASASELARRLQAASEADADAPRVASVDEALAQTLADRLSPGGPIDFHRFEPTVFTEALRVRMRAVGVASVEAYLDLLEDRPHELEAMRGALLRTTGRFFDDAALFEAFDTRILPQLLTQMGKRTELRVWCVGCGTGEVAYSLAMVIAEALERRGARGVELRLFATDVDEAALAYAQDAQYPASVMTEVSPWRAERHLMLEGETARIRRGLRKNVIFARHDVLRDPPFARLDLVVCRGLLGRLRPVMRRRLVSRLLFALRDGGLLAVGESDTLESGDFEVVDSRARIHRRQALGHNGEPLRPRLRDPDEPSTPSTPEALRAQLEASELANEQLRALNAELQASLAELRGANTGLQVEHERLSLLTQSFERTIREEQRLTRLLATLLGEQGMGAAQIDARGTIRWVWAPAGLVDSLPMWAGLGVDDLDDLALARALELLIDPTRDVSEARVMVEEAALRLSARSDLYIGEPGTWILIEHLETDGDR